MNNDYWTIRATLAWISSYLERKNDAHPRRSAEWLLSETMDLSRIELYTDLDRPLSLDERAVLRERVTRRGKGEPLQYVTGSAPFRYLTLRVRSGVLIPRPETEVLVSEALKLVTVSEPLVADIGTGSGAIACSLATERPDVRVFATDIASEAVALARENVAMLKLEDRVEVIQCSYDEGIPSTYHARFDLLISNPPYIPSALVDELPPEVGEYEPRLALDGGSGGLDAYRVLLFVGKRLLKPGGGLAVELHETCLDQAAFLAGAAGYKAIRQVKDLAERPRVLLARA